jgi:hypothetical protein
MTDMWNLREYFYAIRSEQWFGFSHLLSVGESRLIYAKQAVLRIPKNFKFDDPDTLNMFSLRINLGVSLHDGPRPRRIQSPAANALPAAATVPVASLPDNAEQTDAEAHDVAILAVQGVGRSRRRNRVHTVVQALGLPYMVPPGQVAADTTPVQHGRIKVHKLAR